MLIPRLRVALERLNPGASWEAIDLTIEELRRDRASLSLANANREVYALLKDGVRVQVRDRRGNDETVTVRVID